MMHSQKNKSVTPAARRQKCQGRIRRKKKTPLRSQWTRKANESEISCRGVEKNGKGESQKKWKRTQNAKKKKRVT